MADREQEQESSLDEPVIYSSSRENHESMESRIDTQVSSILQSQCDIGDPPVQVKQEPPDVDSPDVDSPCTSTGHEDIHVSVDPGDLHAFKTEEGEEIGTHPAEVESVLSDSTDNIKTEDDTCQLEDSLPFPFPIVLYQNQTSSDQPTSPIAYGEVDTHHGCATTGSGVDQMDVERNSLNVAEYPVLQQMRQDKEQKARKKILVRNRPHTAQEPYTCPTCDYKSTHKSDFVKHARTHTGEKPYECSQCTYRCARKTSLVIHMRTHSGEKPYLCSQCALRFAHNSGLTEHMRTHTGEEKPHRCTECDFRCTYKSVLVAHMRTHTGEKPHLCSDCAFRSAQKSGLVKHMRIHSGEKPHICPQCSYRCTHKYNLVAHMRTHTGEKPHVCSVCAYRCLRRTDLVIHMRTHTGERPHGCPFCDHRSSKKSHLVKHMRTHTGIK